MDNGYVEYNDLGSFAQDVAKKVEAGKREINFFIKAEFKPDSIRNNPLTDVVPIAKKWAQKTVPDDLIINHGSYIGDGMDHLISEIRRKPDSNRALYSLINQKDIDGSGDEPIPSFMVFQCVVFQDTLYCTAYFRALEVCQFLRINLEEMRMNICMILDSVNVNRVRLGVFTFSAYNNPTQNPLEKCELDRMSALTLADRFSVNYAPLANLLDDKARETTAVIDSGLNAINEWLADSRKDKWPKGLNVIPVRQAVTRALDVGRRLREARKIFSYEKSIAAEYVESIQKIAEEIRK